MVHDVPRGTGPKLRHACDRAAHVGGAREHGAAQAVNLLRGSGYRAQPRAQELGNRPHRAPKQIGGRTADQRHPDDPRAEQLRPLFGNREDRHRAHAVTDDDGGPLRRHPVEHGGDVALRKRRGVIEANVPDLLIGGESPAGDSHIFADAVTGGRQLTRQVSNHVGFETASSIVDDQDRTAGGQA